MADPKLPPERPGPVGRAAVALAVLAGLGVSSGADDWSVAARGLVTVQTTLTGGEAETRSKFRPGLRAEVLAPIVLGSTKPRVVGQVVARIGVLDFPDPTTGAAGGSHPAATLALAIEREVGRARLRGPEPAQRVATAFGIEAGYASALSSDAQAGKWAGLVARLTEERDGLELRLVGGAFQIAGQTRPGVQAGIVIPVRRGGTWVVIGADAIVARGTDVVSIFIGGGIR